MLARRGTCNVCQFLPNEGPQARTTRDRRRTRINFVRTSSKVRNTREETSWRALRDLYSFCNDMYLEQHERDGLLRDNDESLLLHLEKERQQYVCWS
jgi:hypothetical protein